MIDLERLKKYQEELAQKIKLVPLQSKPNRIAGADVAYHLERSRAYGAMVLFELPKLIEKEKSLATETVRFPYIPGFLSFREVPVLKAAFHLLKQPPDLILVDGQGILHPRGLGLASHLGLELQVPTVGVAKKPLVGDFETPPDEKGAFRPVYFKGEVRGYVVRTRKGVKPVFVSPGHLIDLEGTLEVVLACIKKFRLPEPIRAAHLLAQRAKR